MALNSLKIYIGEKNPLLANAFSYPRIQKNLMFWETSDQYLVPNIIPSPVEVMGNWNVLCAHLSWWYTCYQRVRVLPTNSTYIVHLKSPIYSIFFSAVSTYHELMTAWETYSSTFCVDHSFFNQTRHNIAKIWVLPTKSSDC